MDREHRLDINKCRMEIDEIDKKMLELFKERMQICAKVAQYKFNNNMNILDKEREEQIIKKNTERGNNEELKPYIKEFFINLMENSKRYQEKLIKDMKSRITKE